MTMWIPDPIYRSLPHVYALSGIGCALGFDLLSPADISAALFLAASTAVALKRRPNKLLSNARASWIARRRRSDSRIVIDLTRQRRLAWRFTWPSPPSPSGEHASR